VVKVAPRIATISPEESRPGAPHLTKMCTSPWEHVAVDWQGRVFPCCNSPSWQNLVPEDELILGDLSWQSFPEIWHGTKLRRFREGLLEGRLAPVCRLCLVGRRRDSPIPQDGGRARLREICPTWSGVRVALRNTGTEVWTPETQLKVASTRPRDRASILRTRPWLSWNRASAMREERVPPGQVATFDVSLRSARAGSPSSSRSWPRAFAGSRTRSSG
jgi:hypothetical protein